MKDCKFFLARILQELKKGFWHLSKQIFVWWNGEVKRGFVGGGGSFYTNGFNEILKKKVKGGQQDIKCNKQRFFIDEERFSTIFGIFCFVFSGSKQQSRSMRELMDMIAFDKFNKT